MFEYTTIMAIMHVILVDCMERCCVGVGRAESKLVLVYMNLKVLLFTYLVFDALLLCNDNFTLHMNYNNGDDTRTYVRSL